MSKITYEAWIPCLDIGLRSISSTKCQQQQNQAADGVVSSQVS